MRIISQYGGNLILKFNIIFFSLQPEIEEWSSWDEDAPTSIKIEGGNGNVPPSPSEENDEPDYFKDMAPTIRKTQKVCLRINWGLCIIIKQCRISCLEIQLQ